MSDQIQQEAVKVAEKYYQDTLLAYQDRPWTLPIIQKDEHLIKLSFEKGYLSASAEVEKLRKEKARMQKLINQIEFACAAHIDNVDNPDETVEGALLTIELFKANEALQSPAPEGAQA